MFESQSRALRCTLSASSRNGGPNFRNSSYQSHGGLESHLTGSFTAVVKLQLPPSRIYPELSLAYHSTATDVSTIGEGWVLKGVSLIERTFPTIAQDGLRGTKPIPITGK
jgi:hypothetical protein